MPENYELGFVVLDEENRRIIRNPAPATKHGNSFNNEALHAEDYPDRALKFGATVVDEIVEILGEFSFALVEDQVIKVANQEPPLLLPISAHFFAGAKNRIAELSLERKIKAVADNIRNRT